ncbi:MAG: DMT family transporter [Ferruginibacter sp.]
MKLSWIIIVFVSGALLPLQGGLNARLGKSIDSPVYASLFSFIVGAITVAIYLQFTKETVSWTGLKSASIYSWLGGGVTGAIFITATMLALPRIGMALTFGLVVAGQLLVATMLDHYDILVAEQHSFNVWRLSGIALIIIGVVIVGRH